MLIRAIHLSNYRSLGDDVSLAFPDGEHRMIVLAGLNGAGKSNVLDALRFIGEAFRGGLDRAIRARHGVSEMLRRGAHTMEIAVEADDDGGRVVWALALSVDVTHNEELCDEWAAFVGEDQLPAWEDAVKGARGSQRRTSRAEAIRAAFQERMEAEYHGSPRRWDGPLQHSIPGRIEGPALVQFGRSRDEAMAAERFATLAQVLRDGVIYELYPSDLRGTQHARSVVPLLDGTGWTSALRTLDDTGARGEFRAAMRQIVPDLIDYRISEIAGELITEFVHRDPDGTAWAVNAKKESDGTLRCAAMLTAMMQDPLPSLLGFEEPELAIHVRALPVLMDQLLVTSTLAPVIVTTHSPDIIDLAPPECLRVVERDERGTRVLPVEELQRRLVRERLATMGALLREEGLRPEGPRG